MVESFFFFSGLLDIKNFSLRRSIRVGDVQPAVGGGVQVCQRPGGLRRQEGGPRGHLHAHDHRARRSHAGVRKVDKKLAFLAFHNQRLVTR